MSELENLQRLYGLSNYGEEKLQFTLFSGGSKPDCSDGLCARNIESHNFFVLGPVLVKFHIRVISADVLGLLESVLMV